MTFLCFSMFRIERKNISSNIIIVDLGALVTNMDDAMTVMSSTKRSGFKRRTKKIKNM